jgi:hypothetical protein
MTHPALMRKDECFSIDKECWSNDKHGHKPSHRENAMYPLSIDQPYPRNQWWVAAYASEVGAICWRATFWVSR